tara:strand:+ start:3261 stop:3905 length:645 start_codon:yes stop_codon:yes gene_type:complete
MDQDQPTFGLYFITDSTLTNQDIFSDTLQAISAGVKIVQYREKDKSFSTKLKEAIKLREITKKHKVTFIINDSVDLVLKTGADGIHLGDSDLPYKEARKLLGYEKIVGLSTHSLLQAQSTAKLSPSYISLGPIFKTNTKPNSRPVGLPTLKSVLGAVRVPVVVIGGIDESNLPSILDTGAKNISAITALVKTSNVKCACQNFISQINQAHPKIP